MVRVGQRWDRTEEGSKWKTVPRELARLTDRGEFTQELKMGL